jgi:hypothetical protein
MNETKLFGAMAKAFAAMEAAIKDSENPHFKSKYADLTAVIATVKPPLIANGLWFTQLTHEQEGGVSVETIVCHESGERFSFGKLFVPASKRDAQGYGSALSYARRYALVTAFGVPVEDDDGNAASKAPPKAAKQEPAKQEEPDFIVPDDVTLAIQLCEALGGSQAQEICKAYKIKTLSQLTKKQGVAVIERLQTKLAEKAKAETNTMASAG